MRKKRMICALLMLVFLLTGCVKSQEEKWELRLFYPAPEYEAGGDVLHSQAVDWSQQEGKEAAEQVRQVVSLLLNKDGSMDFPSPLPQGTELLRCSVSGGIATLDFSAAYRRLSGFDLTVANYCITLSASQIPSVRWIQLLVEGQPLPTRESEYLTTGDVLLTSSEDVVKTVPVTLYFPDAEGVLQPERRELLIYEGENRPLRVTEALLEGSQEEALQKLLPEGVEVAGAWMDGDICCLNFSFASYRKLCEAEVDQALVARGLVQSLCSLSEVQRVQFLVDGAYRNMLGTVNIYLPLSP